MTAFIKPNQSSRANETFLCPASHNRPSPRIYQFGYDIAVALNRSIEHRIAQNLVGLRTGHADVIATTGHQIEHCRRIRKRRGICLKPDSHTGR